MSTINYIDRATGKKEKEKVYGNRALQFLYGDDWISRILGSSVLHSCVKFPFFSALYGLWQKSRFSKKKIKPFVEEFEVDCTEFLEDKTTFRSFNDFFIRKLKAEARPIAAGKDTAVMPADGRYLFYPKVHQVDGFVAKGQKFNLETLLQDASLASRYEQGTMVMARLCPTDYHRFHFPCDCIPGPTRVINGWLYSVNPVAIKRNLDIFTQNKRSYCELQTDVFGTVLFMEIGATNVGSIIQTYTSYKPYRKGDEKGFFSFGASSLILLFEPDRIKLDDDLLLFSADHMEVRCLMGQSLGRKE